MGFLTKRLSMMVGIVPSGSLTRAPTVKATGPRPRTPSAPWMLRRLSSEATPINCLGITTPPLRVTVSLYKVPNINMNMTTYDIFVCHTNEDIREDISFNLVIHVFKPQRLLRVDTGAGQPVLGSAANPSVPATIVDNQVVCIRQPIG